MDYVENVVVPSIYEWLTGVLPRSDHNYNFLINTMTVGDGYDGKSLVVKPHCDCAALGEISRILTLTLTLTRTLTLTPAMKGLLLQWQY